ncbi:MAG: IS200/IS605 family transposase [Planctomycetota bacterium]|nr:IS200/IS605 family transposase [Planctomycetota bacterium]
MAHTYTSLHYHCVFGTLGRKNLIPQDMLARVHGYMGGIVKNIDGHPITIGGTTNHAHLLVTLPGSTAISEGVGKIKSNLSKWVHEKFPAMSGFAWQEGYGAFSVSRSNIDAVTQYIANQDKHHKTMTFQEEFLALLKKHDIEHDERYIWD